MAELPSAIVDAHIHLWDTSRFELPWLADVPELAVRYAPSDLRAAIGDLPVRGTVAVQAGESTEEASWLLDAVTRAEAGGATARVVVQYAPSTTGWLGVAQSAVNRFGELPAGVRVPVHRRAPDWTALQGLDVLLAGLDAHGMVLELLLRPDQIAIVDELAAEYPRLDVVLCHLGLAAAAPTAEWRAAFARVAARPNVSAKISGLFSPRSVLGGSDAGPRTAIAAAMDLLGPDRLLFGSDWPMSTRVGSYSDVVERTALAIPDLTEVEAAAVWRHTAERLYDAGAAR